MLRILIADDEPPARKRLRKLLRPLEEAGRIAIQAEASDGVATLEQLGEHPVDLLFLDIRMPGLDGFDVLERIAPPDRPVVVFTTAYDNYAVRAFEANAVDYLLKPISRERLDEAVQRAERQRSTPTTQQANSDRLTRLLDWVEGHAEPSAAERKPAAETDYLRQLSIPVHDRILVIPVENIVSAEIEDGVTRLFVLEQDPRTSLDRLKHHAVNYTLDQLEANLSPQHFMRVHRSAIVQLDHIRELIPWFSGRYKLALVTGHEVIASRERSKLLKDRLLI